LGFLIGAPALLGGRVGLRKTPVKRG